MAMTPVQLKQFTIPRGLFGYRRAAVDELLDDTTTSFELVWRERADLTERVQQLEADLSGHVELESTLRSTLIGAERAAQAHRERALQEADAILEEAHAKARALTYGAREDNERLATTSREVISLLRSSLATLERAEAMSSAQVFSTAEEPGRSAEVPNLRDPEELSAVTKLAG